MMRGKKFFESRVQYSIKGHTVARSTCEGSKGRTGNGEERERGESAKVKDEKGERERGQVPRKSRE